MSKTVAPNTYEEWLDLMISNAKEVLSAKSIEKRIQIFSNSNDPETIQFRNQYGGQHLEKVVAWFQHASQEYKN